MAQATRVGIVGAGWPGRKHAEGYQAAGGFTLAAVADLIPSRRRGVMEQFGAAREYAEAEELIADKELDVVSVCLPNHLHLPITLAALKAGKHVVCETPPALNAGEAKRIAAAAAKAGKVVLYAMQRRFGGFEQAAKQALEKGYAGNVLHARAAWTRTRGVPTGTGWYADRAKSGGGAMMDLGLHMLDLGWSLLGQPKPLAAFAVFPGSGSTPLTAEAAEPAGQSAGSRVEESAFALVKFEGGRSLELGASWAINQPPQHNGTSCRAYGDKGAVEVYRGADGPALYRGFAADGQAKETILKLPRLTHHGAMMRHLRECLLGRATPAVGAEQGVTLMQIVDAIYKSAATGKSVDVR
jgi:predicted dehydrogenase